MNLGQAKPASKQLNLNKFKRCRRVSKSLHDLRSKKPIIHVVCVYRAKFDIEYSELPEDAVNLPEILLQSPRSK